MIKKIIQTSILSFSTLKICMSLSVSIHAQVPKSGLLFFQLEKSIFKISVITGYQQQRQKWSV